MAQLHAADGRVSYVRLHGRVAAYADGYPDAEPDAWARRIHSWLTDDGGRDEFVHCDEEAKTHAPGDAMGPAARLRTLRDA